MGKLKGKSKAKFRAKKNLLKKKKHQGYKDRLVASILKYDNEVLKSKCEKVEKDTDISDDCKQMGKVLAATKNGVGLASSQIGISKRIIALRPDPQINDITFMINPEIVKKSETVISNVEGCLSYPNVYGAVDRHIEITVKYYDENWKEYTKEFVKDDSRTFIVQHEIDHLNGHCALYDWWKDPEGMQKKLIEKQEKENNEE